MGLNFLIQIFIFCLTDYHIEKKMKWEHKNLE